MKVAAVQFGPEFGATRRNLARMEALVAGTYADLYVLPELALSGYLFESRDEAWSLAQAPDDDAFNGLAGLARERGAVVIVGFAERAGSALYNASLLIRPGGARSVYRKIHLFDSEKTIFEPGDRPTEVHEFGGIRLGLMICFDWIFPETARSLAVLGADILCHSANLVLPYCQDAMVTRAIENRVFAITANRTGREERAGASLRFTGRSEIVAPKGEVIARAGSDDDEVLVADIDPTLARNKRVTPRNDIMADRRPDLYRLGGADPEGPPGD
jgi:predicted amidohydrolase